MKLLRRGTRVRFDGTTIKTGAEFACLAGSALARIPTEQRCTISLSIGAEPVGFLSRASWCEKQRRPWSGQTLQPPPIDGEKDRTFADWYQALTTGTTSADELQQLIEEAQARSDSDRETLIKQLDGMPVENCIDIVHLLLGTNISHAGIDTHSQVAEILSAHDAHSSCLQKTKAHLEQSLRQCILNFDLDDIGEFELLADHDILASMVRDMLCRGDQQLFEQVQNILLILYHHSGCLPKNREGRRKPTIAKRPAEISSQL